MLFSLLLAPIASLDEKVAARDNDPSIVKQALQTGA